MQKEIFKSGTWTDSAGRTRKWANADLDKMVSTFNPANREIPMVVGHPKTDSPAYGWVKKVWRDGNGLWAEFKEVVKEMQTAIDKKMFKNTSISINADGTLRHVGFLGGVQPAVPGLGKIQFEENADIATIDFSDLPDDDKFESIEKIDFFAFMAENSDSVVQSLVFSKEKTPTIEDVKTWVGNNPQFMANELKETKSNFRATQKKTGDFESLKSVLLADGIDAIIGKIKQSKKGNNMDFEKQCTKLEGELEIANGKIKEIETALEVANKNFNDATTKFEAEQTAHNETKTGIETARVNAMEKSEKEFVDGLIKDRKMKPADSALALITLASLRDADEIEFSNADGKKEKISAQKKYMENLNAVEPFVSDSEDFTDGVEANKDLKLSKLSKARSSEKNITLSEATAEIISENPTLG